VLKRINKEVTWWRGCLEDAATDVAALSDEFDEDDEGMFDKDAEENAGEDDRFIVAELLLSFFIFFAAPFFLFDSPGIRPSSRSF